MRLWLPATACVWWTDPSTGSSDNLPAAVEFIPGSVTDPAAMREPVGRDAVIHLAALVSVPHSLTEPAVTHLVNTTGTVVTAEAARQAGVQRLVLASTCPSCRAQA